MSKADRIARVRIELDDTDPAIWRRVEVPLTTSLKGLHDVIQAVMPFEDYHLFEFEIGDKRYGIPDPEWDDVRQTFDARNIKLAALVDRGVGRFSYTYDFGDNWQHTVNDRDDYRRRSRSGLSPLHRRGTPCAARGRRRDPRI